MNKKICILIITLTACLLSKPTFGFKLPSVPSPIENATAKFKEWTSKAHEATEDWLQKSKTWSPSYLQAAAAAKPIITEQIPELTSTLWTTAKKITDEIKNLKTVISRKGELTEGALAAQTTEVVVKISNYLDDMLKAITSIVNRIGSEVVKPVNPELSDKIVKVTSTINYLMEIFDKQSDLLTNQLGPIIEKSINLIIQLIEVAKQQPVPPSVEAIK